MEACAEAAVCFASAILFSSLSISAILVISAFCSSIVFAFSALMVAIAVTPSFAAANASAPFAAVELALKQQMGNFERSYYYLELFRKLFDVKICTNWYSKSRLNIN